MIKELLTEKVRPKKFSQLCLPERIKKSLSYGTLGQNVLLHGSAGVGKTSTAKVLALGSPTLYINVSDESSVEVIRTKITDFCSQMSILDDGNENELAPKQDNGQPYKMVILDEIDGASAQFHQALRATVEKFHKTCRFIATCNFVNKLPDPILSRFECINFDFINKEEENEVKEEWRIRMKALISKLFIEIDDESLNEFVDANFPDMRSALNKIQSFSIRGLKEITKTHIKEASWSYEDLYKMLVSKPDPVKNYEYIVGNYSNNVDDVMSSLGKEFIDWLKTEHPTKVQAIPQLLITTATHQAQRVHVIDEVVSLLSLCFTMQNILNNVK